MMMLVSMLRGVNVAGYTRVKMSALAEAYASLGFADVRTYVQSGNVVFATSAEDASKVGDRIEKALRDRLGLDARVFIRTPDDLARLASRNPFIQRERTRLHVTLLYDEPSSIPMDKLNAARGRGEEFSISGKEVFLFLPNGYGRSKLSNSFFEKTLGVDATTRNWNTVTALSTMASEKGQVASE